MLTNIGYIECFWDATSHGSWALRFTVLVIIYDEQTHISYSKAIVVLNSTSNTVLRVFL